MLILGEAWPGWELAQLFPHLCMAQPRSGGGRHCVLLTSVCWAGGYQPHAALPLGESCVLSGPFPRSAIGYWPGTQGPAAGGAAGAGRGSGVGGEGGGFLQSPGMCLLPLVLEGN